MIGDLLRARLGHNRASRLWSTGEHRAAIAVQDGSIARFARIRPGRRQRVLEFAAIVSAGAGYAYAMTDTATATDRYRQVIDRLATVPTGRSRDEAMVGALIGLGNCQRLSGDFADSHANLVAGSELARGARLDSTVVASAWNALGILAKDTGRYEGAAHHYRAAISALGSGDDRTLPLAASLQHNLAGLAHVQRRFDEGEAPARRAVDLRRQVARASETDIAADETVLGAILTGQGRLDEAEAMFRHAIAAWSARFGSDHYEVAVNLHNLAAVHQARGHLDAAENSLQRAMKIQQHVLGDRHPEIAALLNDLAALDAARGQFQNAKRRYDQALTLFRATLGADHPKTKTCQENRALLTASPTPTTPPASG